MLQIANLSLSPRAVPIKRRKTRGLLPYLLSEPNLEVKRNPCSNELSKSLKPVQPTSLNPHISRFESIRRWNNKKARLPIAGGFIVSPKHMERHKDKWLQEHAYRCN